MLFRNVLQPKLKWPCNIVYKSWKYKILYLKINFFLLFLVENSAKNKDSDDEDDDDDNAEESDDSAIEAEEADDFKGMHGDAWLIVAHLMRVDSEVGRRYASYWSRMARDGWKSSQTVCFDSLYFYFLDLHLNVCVGFVDMLKSLKLIVDDLKWKWLNKWETLEEKYGFFFKKLKMLNLMFF